MVIKALRRMICAGNHTKFGIAGTQGELASGGK